LITRLGADAFGDEARSILLAEGLPEHGITTDAQSPTGIALVLVDDSGQNAIAVAPGANLELSAPEVLESFGEDLRSCQCLLMQLECRAELAAGLASWAREAGCVSILNPAPARPLPEDALASFDIITPNEGELELLATSLGLPVGVGGGSAVFRCLSGPGRRHHGSRRRVQRRPGRGPGPR
jgi:ribokinase